MMPFTLLVRLPTKFGTHISHIKYATEAIASQVKTTRGDDCRGSLMVFPVRAARLSRRIWVYGKTCPGKLHVGGRSNRPRVYIPPCGQVGIFPPCDRYGRTSSQVGAPSGVLRLSTTHCCVAPSIWRRLLMHEFQHVFRGRLRVGRTEAVTAKANTTPTLMIDLLDMCVRALKPSSHHCRVNDVGDEEKER
jgi:hypothetical protein